MERRYCCIWHHLIFFMKVMLKSGQNEFGASVFISRTSKALLTALALLLCYKQISIQLLCTNPLCGLFMINKTLFSD